MNFFGKANSSSAGKLNERLRQIAERALSGSAPVSEYMALRKKQERLHRAAVFRNATIIFDSGERMIVAVKDISISGARLEFFSHAPLPETFIVSELMMKLKRRARVVWQREGAAGIAFL